MLHYEESITAGGRRGGLKAVGTTESLAGLGKTPNLHRLRQTFSPGL